MQLRELAQRTRLSAEAWYIRVRGYLRVVGFLVGLGIFLIGAVDILVARVPEIMALVTSGVVPGLEPLLVWMQPRHAVLAMLIGFPIALRYS